MDQDLQDLLALWRGDHDPGAARRKALLARLRDSADFRRAFVEEVRLLGMLRSVPSSQTCWQRLADEADGPARQGMDDEMLAVRVLQEWRRRRVRHFVRYSAAVAFAAGLVAAGLFLAFRPGEAPPDTPPVSPQEGAKLATAIKVDDVRWAEGNGATLGEGSVVSPGRLRLLCGRLTLAFFSGVSLSIEGPADVELRGPDSVFCHHGKLRVRISRGAEGFTVLAAGHEIVDLGTEFAFNLEPGGKSRVMVFEGEAAVSMLDKDGRSVRSALLGRHKSVEVDPDAGRIQDVPAQPEAFIPLGQFVPAPLELDADYAKTVLAAKPWGYWRFESLEGRCVPNEVAGGPALKAQGGVRLEQSPGGNRWAYYRLGDHAQAFEMDGEWAPPRAGGYAIEVWVQADLPSPSAFGQTALVGLIAKDDMKASNHIAYLELAGRGRRFPHEPCAVRFLDRWPAAMTGGTDVFSRRTVVPSLWHHVVGQKSGDTLELYVDGEQVGTSPAKADVQAPEDAATTACHLLVGRLKRFSRPPDMSEIRPFEGRLDELAVYNHPLSPDEISRHARLRTAGPGR
jgi:hypothetical protein